MGQHQKPEVSKRKRHDAVFRVKTVRQKSRRWARIRPMLLELPPIPAPFIVLKSDQRGHRRAKSPSSSFRPAASVQVSGPDSKRPDEKTSASVSRSRR